MLGVTSSDMLYWKIDKFILVQMNSFKAFNTLTATILGVQKQNLFNLIKNSKYSSKWSSKGVGMECVIYKKSYELSYK